MGTFSVLGGGNHNLNIGHGHDTIAIAGYGTDLITTTGKGSAVVFALPSFTAATVIGGSLDITNSPSLVKETVIGGNATLQGGFGPDSFSGGTGNHVTMIAGFGNDTFVAGSGHDLFAFEPPATFGHSTDIIKDFSPGQDTLYVDGKSLNYLTNHNDITIKNGSTFITYGGTTIELKGVADLTPNITTHKP